MYKISSTMDTGTGRHRRWIPATCLALTVGLGTGSTPAAELPVVYEGQKLLASDLDSKDNFGTSLALEGDTLLVGAPDARGCDGCSQGGQAYLYSREGGMWNEIAVLKGSETGTFDRFGVAVALAGDLAFVGAHEPSSGHLIGKGRLGDEGTGKVYVFENGVEVARLAPSDGDRGDEFGEGLAVSGKTLFVAAPKASYPGGGGASWAGRVYVFEQGPGGADDWTEVDQLSLPFVPEEAFEEFGWKLAADGDTLFVTSIGNNVPPAVDKVVWVHRRDAAGVWRLEEILGSSDQEINAGFGDALAIDGDRAIIGASLADSEFPNKGAAYVFERDAGGNWREVTKLQENIDNIARYGLGVDIDGDVAVVGARGAIYSRGAAFVYHKNQGGPDQWGLVSLLLASDGENADELGNSVAIDGLTVTVGARNDDDACGPGGSQNCDSGAVYVFGEL